ncbi:MAG: hypothetical protein K0Q95_2256 [Bacteroidota bacterium]|jgi:hypothetical protein|nr:hypothetical protein [Bacteroidota bacterium]
MFKNTLGAALLLSCTCSFSQITITTFDLPAGGDHILTSVALTAGTADLSLTGPNTTWDFSTLIPSFQRYEIFDAAGSYSGYYNALYNPFTGIPTTYGKVNFTASLIPIPGLTVSAAYDFFKKSTTNLKQVGLAYTLNDSLPLPFEYNVPDVVYNFPLNYQDADTCNFQYKPHHLIPTGTLPFYYGGTGTRFNEVDGWGMLTTPFGSFNTLRVKSTIMQTDTLYLDSTIGGFATPRPLRIEYKWLAVGKKVPVLQIEENIIGGAPVVTNVTYLDSLRSQVPYVGISELEAATDLQLYPNPASEKATLEFSLNKAAKVKISILNILGQTASSVSSQDFPIGKHTVSLNVGSLEAGIYFVSMESGTRREVRKLVIQ